MTVPVLVPVAPDSASPEPVAPVLHQVRPQRRLRHVPVGDSMPA